MVKKKFIDKKTAAHFQVVHRSLHDEGADDSAASNYVLVPANANAERRQVTFNRPNFVDTADDFDNLDEDEGLYAGTKNKNKNASSSNVRDIDEHGFKLDGYNYTQHLRAMGTGTFVGNSGRVISNPIPKLTERVVLPDEVLPSELELLSTHVESITTGEMEVADAEMLDALENPDAYEEILDDFVVTATEKNEDDADEFDFDAHFAKMMQQAQRADQDGSDDDDSGEDEDEDDSDEEDAGLENMADEQLQLEKQFQQMLQTEYDDYEIGDLDGEDPSLQGTIDMESAVLDEVMDEFLNDDSINKKVRDVQLSHVKSEDGVVTDDVDLETLDEDGKRKHIIQKRKGDITDLDHIDELDSDDEKELKEMTEKYFSGRVENQWDCESITSTYSNLDNHPHLLKVESKKKTKKNKGAPEGQEQYGFIKLSDKTGMPLGVFENNAAYDDDDQYSIVSDGENLGIKRDKKEGAEDKKLRKQMLKDAKRAQRVQKKQLKETFKSEKQRQERIGASNPSSSQTIFKY